MWFRFYGTGKLSVLCAVRYKLWFTVPFYGKRCSFELLPTKVKAFSLHDIISALIRRQCVWSIFVYANETVRWEMVHTINICKLSFIWIFILSKIFSIVIKWKHVKLKLQGARQKWKACLNVNRCSDCCSTICGVCMCPVCIDLKITLILNLIR